jgi:F-type H+-transporting ATPase subunit gamma
MPTVKEYNVRIARLRNTRKMTKTMKMVAANKLRKAQEALKHAAAFESHVLRMAGAVPAGGKQVHPLEVPRPARGHVLVLLVTSDRGLCGGFNNNLNRAVMVWAEERRAAGKKAAVSFFGRRGYLFLRKRLPVRKYYRGESSRPAFAAARQIAMDLQDVFLAGRYEAIYLAYNRFRSVLSQAPVIERILPMEPAPVPAPAPAPVTEDMIFTPGAEAVRDTIAGQAVALRIFSAFLNSAVGEQGARMTAMESSTTNADNLIESYTLRRNRARQAAITRELIEIVAGAEALV